MNRKNNIWILTFAGLTASLFLGGCTPGSVIDHFSGKDNVQAQPPLSTAAVRVYMDEVSGKLSYFDGSMLSLESDGLLYDFDLYGASIECANGLLYGDEISVIYEGQMTGNQTDSVQALKVTDAFHKKEKLKRYTIKGTIQAFTPNALTLTTSDKKSLTCLIAGRRACFSEGLSTGKTVYLRVLGKKHLISGNVLDGSLLTILGVSDQKSFRMPEPPDLPTVTTEPAESTSVLRKMRAVIESVNGQLITIKPLGGDALLSLDLSVTPLYAQCGILPGTVIELYYYGQYNGENLGGITIDQIRGLDSSQIKPSEITSSLQGTITGVTANTVSVQTPDGVFFTGNTNSVPQDYRSLEEGSQIRITIDPYASSRTNIYKIIKIEDG